MIGRLQLVVFDMAGTTVEVGDLVPTALREALAPLGVTLDDETIRSLRGRSKRDAIAELVAVARRTRGEPGATAAACADAFERFNQAMEQGLPGVVRPVPGAEETFTILRRRGVRVALTTGFARRTALAVLDALAWTGEHVDAVITADDVAHGRPAPDLIIEAMRRTDVHDRHAVVAVGDTTADLEAARRAGVAGLVAVLTGAHEGEALRAFPNAVVLPSVAELPAWLDTAWKGRG